MTGAQILHGDCVEVMATLQADSIDAVVTDPPYELGFMGKKWDSTGIAYSQDLWRAVLRVLKPGGHVLAFGGSRTYHRMAVAIEDAGFEIRDSLMWLYGSGFPKSLDVSKALDRHAGEERTVVGPSARHSGRTEAGGAIPDLARYGTAGDLLTAPASDEAKRWAGWGTALKPAHEPIVMARKPLIGTVAANVVEFGTGGLNIEGCRIAGAGAEAGRTRHGGGIPGNGSSYELPDSHGQQPAGRWPANVTLDEEAAAMLDAQSGTLVSGAHSADEVRTTGKTKNAYAERAADPIGERPVDRGGASRFFYVAKPSRFDRDAGLEDLPSHSAGDVTDRQEGSDGLKSPRAGAGRTSEGVKNHHPTVKPVLLMEWLVRLVTPPGGIVLDPFLGSGTTGAAAVRQAFGFVGIEREAEYVEIAKRRIDHWSKGQLDLEGRVA